MRSDARLPLVSENFIELFDIFRGNLRTVLASCDDFCLWLSEEHESPSFFDDELFPMWLKDEMFNAFDAVKSEIRPKAFEVFELACKFEVFSPSDCEEFGYKTPMALRPQIKVLEEAGLLISTQDDTDKRRKTIQVSAKGWKVAKYLERYGNR